VRVLGLPVPAPGELLAWPLRDLAALERLLLDAPRQLDRLLALGEELVDIGQRVLVIAERLDRRAEAIFQLGERLDDRANQLLALGGEMRDLGGQIDVRGAEIVDRAGQVVTAAADLSNVLPTIERALDLATPLEGAIDRFGRLVDRFPGGATGRRRPVEPEPEPEPEI
jgi:hypothetical protein